MENGLFISGRLELAGLYILVSVLKNHSRRGFEGLDFKYGGDC